MSSLIRSYYNIKLKHQGAVLTIGHFDGVHLGHQKLLAATIQKAKELKTSSIVLSFEPHAFEFFNKQKVTVPRLSRLREKLYLLSQTGIDNILIIPFNQKLANMSASDFVIHLYEKLKPIHIILGDDFRFGYQRQGDVKLLENMGKELGFSVSILQTISIFDKRVSSTRVREALALGQHHLVKELLGHPYFMLGRVRHGDQLGRQWGFPTINIDLHRKLTPVHGVYTVYVHGLSNSPLPGVANVGSRPTIDGTKTLLEVHLLDFNQDVYGAYVKVEFCEKLRDEIRFASIDELKLKIAEDVKIARELLMKKKSSESKK